jgi:HPt (histidine-containing phosphotransfer) domain-containing protein
MSDYLTKPIEVKELERVLKRYLGGGSEKDSRIIEKENIYTKNNISNKGVLMISVPENSFEPISKALISSELGLPEMFIDKLIGKFLEGLDKSFEDLKSAIENRNSEDIKNFAHKLKGSSANLRFKYLAELLKVIEYSGKDGVVDGFDELLDEIKKEIEVIRNFAKA